MQIKQSSNDCYNILGTSRFLFVYSFSLSQAGRAAPFPQYIIKQQEENLLSLCLNRSASASAARARAPPAASVLALSSCPLHRGSLTALIVAEPHPSHLPLRKQSIPPNHGVRAAIKKVVRLDNHTRACFGPLSRDCLSVQHAGRQRLYTMTQATIPCTELQLTSTFWGSSTPKSICETMSVRVTSRARIQMVGQSEVHF